MRVPSDVDGSRESDDMVCKEARGRAIEDGMHGKMWHLYGYNNVAGEYKLISKQVFHLNLPHRLQFIFTALLS
jgi:hypothetical protein